MLKKKLICFVALLLVLLFPTQVTAESRDFASTQDTYANLAYPDKVVGSQQSIMVSNKNTTRLGYIQFEDINLPEGAIIDSGTLRLYVYIGSYAEVARFTIGPIDGNWDENTVTWNNKPATNLSQTQNAEISISEIGWKEIIITNYVRQWHDGTLDNFGLFIYTIDYLQAVAEPPFAIAFKPRDSAENKVRLEVEYHFEPTPTSAPTQTPMPTSTPEPTVTLTPTLEATTTPNDLSTPTVQPVDDESMVLDDESLESEQSTKAADENNDKLFGTSKTVVGVVILFCLVFAGGVGFVLYQKKQKRKSKIKKDKTQP